MAVVVYVSFDHDDQKQVDSFNLFKKNSKHLLDFHDHYFKELSTAGEEKFIKCQLNDNHSKLVREEILKKFEKCSKLVVLIGDTTHKNNWVEWEVNNFYKKKESLFSGKAWKSIRGVSLEGFDKAIKPKALECRSMSVLAWDLEVLDKWIEEDANL